MDHFIKLKSFVTAEEKQHLTDFEIKKLYQKLKGVPYQDRILKFALKPDRADVIIPAAIATIEIMKMARADKIHLPRVGIRDGLLQDLSSTARDSI